DLVLRHYPPLHRLVDETEGDALPLGLPADQVDHRLLDLDGYPYLSGPLLDVVLALLEMEEQEGCEELVRVPEADGLGEKDEAFAREEDRAHRAVREGVAEALVVYREVLEIVVRYGVRRAGLEHGIDKLDGPAHR